MTGESLRRSGYAIQRTRSKMCFSPRSATDASENGSGMLSSLSDAVWRCQARRLRTLVATAPVPAGLVAALVLAAPLALVRVGGSLGDELAAAAASAAVTNAVVVGLVLASAIAGAAGAASLPGRAALGPQFAAGPSGEADTVVAGLLFPVALGAIVTLPSLVALTVAVGSRLPGGPSSGVALATAAIAALPAGAILAEAGLAAARGRRRCPAAVALGAGIWCLLGLIGGSVALGPLSLVGSALRGEDSAPLAVAIAGSCAGTFLLAWIALAAKRPPQRPRTPKSGRRVVHLRCGPVVAAVAALVGRRDDVRRATVAALVFGAAGTAVAVAARAPAPAPFLLGSTTTLLGSILWPLVAPGVLLDGRWLWGTEPGSRLRVSVAACVSALVGSATPVLVVGLIATRASGASVATVATVGAFVAIGGAAALLAGLLVPWRSRGLGDQIASFAALAATAIAVSLALGFVAPRIVALGVPDLVLAVLVCSFGWVCAGGALARRLGANG